MMNSSDAVTIVERLPLPKPARAKRSLRKSLVMLLRRGHLYFGLFLFPWAVLYGVTAFLFNHPSAFSDRQSVSFGADAVAGTPLESLLTPEELAGRVVAKLNARDGKNYSLARPAECGYNREFAFATAKAEGQTINIAFEVADGRGTVRGRPDPIKGEVEKAPFESAGRSRAPRTAGKAPKGPAKSQADSGLRLEAPLHERFQAALPIILERTGFSGNEIVVTSVPDLTFFVDDAGKLWKASYNPQTGALTGRRPDEGEGEIPFRRFLTRLHTTHGYPASFTAVWFWALIVDLMAFIIVFWGVTGLIMWMQIKATRRAGLAVLILSAAAAGSLGFFMHRILAAAG